MSWRKIDWRSEVPVALEAVEAFCSEFRAWRLAECAGLNPFSTELLLREALTNSVIHGCARDSARRIQCVLRVKPGRLVIAINDDGPGFDWRAAWDRQSDISEDRGRGVEIYRRYADTVRFNPSGNSVVLVKRFDG